MSTVVVNQELHQADALARQEKAVHEVFWCCAGRTGGAGSAVGVLCQAGVAEDCAGC